MASIDPVPSVPAVAATPTKNTAVKYATSDIVLINQEQLPEELMASVIFEEIGGQELLSMTRNDILNGQSVSYQIIKNLQDVFIQYNSQNLIPISDSSANHFKNYSLRLDDYIPSEDELAEALETQMVYLDSTTGNLVVNLTNISDEKVDISIFEYGTAFDDTIYEDEGTS